MSIDGPKNKSVNGAAPARWTLANEFGHVELSLDRRGNDVRLCIEDLTSGKVILLDAFVLASLVTTSADNIERHLDPHPPGMDDDDL
jgi:hypothetical protein